MRTQARPLLIALAVTLAGTGAAWAQADSGDNSMTVLQGRSSDAVRGANAASDSALSGNGSVTYTETYARPDMGVSASPTESVQSGTADSSPGRTSRVARLIDNGTAMNYGKSGANSIGDTGGMTTGARGSAGIVAGGGGVHTANGVVSPGANNGGFTDDVASRPARVALGSDDAQEHAARSVGADPEAHGAGAQRSDDAEERRARAALKGEDTTAAPRSDDAQERAARAAATNPEEEEHGGFWNRVRNFFHHDND